MILKMDDKYSEITSVLRNTYIPVNDLKKIEVSPNKRSDWLETNLRNSNTIR